MAREFFLGFIKIHILHHAAEEAVYGLALLSELQRHGYELSPGTMYPVLHGLERAEYLHRVDRVVNGKVRKYYAITKSGAAALADARKKLRELVDEVLQADVGTRATRSGRGSGDRTQGPGDRRRLIRRGRRTP
jgi:DNA-binding PadR family transcriptional regulator